MWWRAVVLALACCSSSGCYVVQAAGGQWEVGRRSEPIVSVLADPATDATIRERLELVTLAREYAVEELGLPDGRSYQAYADLGRPFVLYNVVATAEFDVKPRRWCFPVAGCVTYRGYFDEQRARSFALRLATSGDDVSVGGVPAYSTLGHFADPVFRPMLDWREDRLVGTLFHELAHEALYVAGDSEFNEAFASVVEEEGLRRWLQSNGKADALPRIERAAAREVEFAELLREARKRLSRLYSSGLPVDAMRIEKQREFGRLKFDYEQLKRRWGGYGGYDTWFAQPLNNARLAAVATYHDCVPGLRLVLEQAASLENFYERARELAALTRQQRHDAVCRASPAGSARPADEQANRPPEG